LNFAFNQHFLWSTVMQEFSNFGELNMRIVEYFMEEIDRDLDYIVGLRL
jgi:hypothetical protein